MTPTSAHHRSTARRWRDRIVAADPGRYALRIALRATLSLGLSTVVLLALAAPIGQPTTVAFVGAQIAMMVSSGIVDPHRSAQRWTFGIAILASAAVDGIVREIAGCVVEATVVRWHSGAGEAAD
jgi:hypothetical protein